MARRINASAIACIFTTVLLADASAADCRSLNSVEWVLGDWATLPTRVVIRESWHRVSDTTFEGESVTTSVSDGELLNFESLRLVAMSDGVFYIAKVREHDLPIPFRLTQCVDGIAVFENPGHDAPQRLIYRGLVSPAEDHASEMEVRLEGEGMQDFSLRFRRP